MVDPGFTPKSACLSAPTGCPRSTQSTVKGDESDRISLQHSNCYLTPFPWFRYPKGRVTNQTLLLSRIYSEAKQKTRWALALSIIVYHPEEYFHNLSLWMNSSRGNTSLCNIRGQATWGRKSQAHKDINLPLTC